MTWHNFDRVFGRIRDALAVVGALAAAMGLVFWAEYLQ